MRTTTDRLPGLTLTSITLDLPLDHANPGAGTSGGGAEGRPQSARGRAAGLARGMAAGPIEGARRTTLGLASSRERCSAIADRRAMRWF